MSGKRMLKNTMLKNAAVAMGLEEQSQIIVRERSMLKDGEYITRKIRRGTVIKLYDHHFYCLMSDGTRESFRYNEFLGDEARLIRSSGKSRALGA